MREDDIDNNLTNNAIRAKIRKDFIRDATVLILLCGEGTKGKKYVDYELQAAMYKDANNKPLGIVVINVPPLKEGSSILSADDNDSLIIDKGIKWKKLKDEETIHLYFPYLPHRIVDNIMKFKNDKHYYPISIVHWKTIKKNPLLLKILVDNAHNRVLKADKHYDNSRAN